MSADTEKGRSTGPLPAARGAAWFMESLALLRRQTSRLLFIAILMQLVLGLVQVPLLGILVVLSVPGLTAGILQAFHVTARGGAPAMRLLFLPLATGNRRGRLFALGALVFAVGILCVSVILGGALANVDEATLLRLQQGDMEALAEVDPLFMSRLFAAFAFSLAISGTLTFFSVPLVWFRDRGVWPAISAGLGGLLRHWKALLVLGLVLAAASLPLVLLIGVLLQMVTAGGVAAYIATGLVMVLLLLFQLLLFGTQYCSFRDIFGLSEPVPPSGEDGGDDGGNGQLVA
ncbi:MAG: BPSS1780 family membrane protein [Xanthomonadales bacterium]